MLKRGPGRNRMVSIFPPLLRGVMKSLKNHVLFGYHIAQRLNRPVRSEYQPLFLLCPWIIDYSTGCPWIHVTQQHSLFESLWLHTPSSRSKIALVFKSICWMSQVYACHPFSVPPFAAGSPSTCCNTPAHFPPSLSPLRSQTVPLPIL